MNLPYYRLMGQIFVAIETWDSLPDVREAMSKVGLTKDQIDEGRSLVEEGQKLVNRRREEAGGERIAFHNAHQAAAEVEMWLQTVTFSLRGRVDDEAQVMERAIEHGLHADDHNVTVIASTLRTLGVLCTDERVKAGYDRRQTLHDLLVRGQTLLAKLVECTEVMVADGATARRSDIFAELRDHQQKMNDWVVALAESAQQIKEQAEILGLLGYVPEGVGLPTGGTSFAVPLHKRARREAPDPAGPGSTSGWSIGRQGRNRENMGKGFLEPTFE